MIHRFEGDLIEKGQSNEVSDMELLRRAGAKSGVQAPSDTAQSATVGSSSTTEASEEGDVARPCERRSPSRSVEHAQHSQKDRSLDLKVKEEVRTDSEHEDEGADELLGAGPEDDEEIVVVEDRRARKRRRLDNLLGPDDEDEYVPR